MAEQTHFRTCNLCEAMCGLEIKYEGNTVTSIKGDKKDPFSRGHICPKALALKDIYEDPDRLRKPIRRTENGWEEMEWEAAFAYVGENIRRIQDQYGNDAMAVYQGNPSVHNLGTMMYARDFVRTLKTRNRYSATSVDQLPHHIAAWKMFGHMNLLPIPDLDRTNYLLIMGGNPLVSNGSIMTAPDIKNRLKAIQERGGKIVVIDPRKTQTAKMADEHLFIRPGTDVFLLLGICHVLYKKGLVKPGKLEAITDGWENFKAVVEDWPIERVGPLTGIPSEDIERLAMELGQADKAVCYGRLGLSTVEFGALSLWLVNAVNLITGNMDREGGMMFTKPAFDTLNFSSKSRRYMRWHSRVRKLPEFGGELPVATLAEEMLEPGEGQIKGLVTSCGNPVLSTPNGAQLDKALGGLDFMVSIDIYLNETTRHANVILPPATGLETAHYDLVFHGLAIRNTAKYSPALFDKSPGAKYDWEIFQALIKELDPNAKPAIPLAAKAMQSLRGGDTPQNRLDMGLRFGPYGKGLLPGGLSLKKLKKYPHGLDIGPLEPCFPDRLFTKEKRISLADPFFLNDLPRLSEYEAQFSTDSLMLIGRRNLRSNNSWMHNSARLIKGPNSCTLIMNPLDAEKRKIHDGNLVSVQSRVGEVVLPVEISEEIMPGTVSIPHGWGHAHPEVNLTVAKEKPGVSINDLTDDRLIDQLSGNAALNGVPVQVKSVVSEPIHSD